MKKKYHLGFTLIELIIVITVLGIITVAAVPKIQNLGLMRSGLAVEKVAADMRYAKRFAINHNCWTIISFVVASDAYVMLDNSSGPYQMSVDPTTRKAFNINLNSGVYQGVGITSASFGGSTLVAFDPQGVPYGFGPFGPLSSDGVAVIGSAAKSIYVEAGSGRIYLQ